MVYSTDRSKAVVPVLVLLFVALWFILRGDLFYVLPCVILFLCFFSPFSIAITSLGEETANLSAFSYVCSICACLVLSVSSSSWGLGRAAVVIVALPGLLSYLFLRSSVVCAVLEFHHYVRPSHFLVLVHRELNELKI